MRLTILQPRSICLILMGTLVAGSVILPALVSAQPNFDFDVGIPGGSKDPTRNVPPQQRIGDLIITVINILLSLAAVLALGSLIWGSIVLIVSWGSEDKVKTAKKVMISAIVGLILIGLSFLIVAFIGQQLGVEKQAVEAPKPK